MSEERPAVLITGAAGGIGTAAVRLLAERGHRVFAGVHSTAPLLDGLRRVEVLPFDVSDPNQVGAAADAVSAAVGDRGLRAVVNNAGVIVQGPLELVPPGELRRQFEVNTFGPAYVTQAFLPLLRLGRGRVINVSAPSANTPMPFMGPISASKAALASMSEALRTELAAWDIPVVLVEPDSTDTQIFVKAGTRARRALDSADPATAALYAPHLAAVENAMAQFAPGPIQPVARAILTAVEADRPRRRYCTGRARMLSATSWLPVAVRERLIARLFGLTQIPRAVEPAR